MSAGSVVADRRRRQTRGVAPVGLRQRPASGAARGGQRRVGQRPCRSAPDSVSGGAWQGRHGRRGARGPVVVVSPACVVPSPGVVSGDVPAPAWSSVVGRRRARTGQQAVGIGGRLMPNCDRPCDSADISSLGRSVIRAAWTNSRCCGRGLGARGQLGYGDHCNWTCDCQGGDCAHGCREPASTSVRHGSLLNIWTTCLVGARAITSSAATDSVVREPISADVIDGTGVTDGSRVTIRNCEPIAT